MNAPATEADLRVDLLPETRAFLRDWLDWVERGAPYAKPYMGFVGLCANSTYYDPNQEVMCDLLRAFDAYYPFGESDYYRRQNASTMHECPKRLAWARANASAPA